MQASFITAGVAIAAFMLVFFVLASVIKNNSIVDVGWGLGFVVVAFTTFLQLPTNTLQQQILLVLVTVWGLRLAGYILMRNFGKPEDYRYVQMRQRWGKYQLLGAFFNVFVLQGVLMYLIAMPIMLVNSANSGGVNALSWLGVVLWCVGFFFEAVGDYQKSQFKRNHANRGRIMTTGLWRYTRHPNYFGEALMWWGIFLISLPSGYWYIAIVSPLMINFLIVKVSGVAMLEKKYVGNSEFADYARRTSSFIPMLPKKTTK